MHALTASCSLCAPAPQCVPCAPLRARAAAQVWDLRKRRAVYTLPAHTSLVSTVRWQPGTGALLLTAGYDNSAKLWCVHDWRCVRVLSGHEGKVMAADLSPAWGGCGSSSGSDAEAGLLVGSASYDRTVKVWAPEDEAPALLLGADDGGGGSGGNGALHDSDGGGDDDAMSE